MRIGIDIRSTQNDSGVRGIGRYAFDVVDGLARYAPENEYFLFAYPDKALPRRIQTLPGNCRVVPVPTFQLDSAPREGQEALTRKLWWGICRETNIRRNSRALSAVIRQERIEVIHLTNVFEGTFFTHGRYPCLVVKTIHDMIPLVLADLFVNNWPYRIRTMYEQQVKGAALGVDRVTAISESAKNDAVKYLQILPSRVQVVYNGIGDGFVTKPDPSCLSATCQKYGIDGDYFLYCGGGGPNKNRERMVRASASLLRESVNGSRPCQIVIAGPEADDESLLHDIIRDSGLREDRLRILGFIPDDDLVQLMSGAVAVLMATLYEGFGLPAAQAMQLGTPVIGADRGALPEVIGDAGLLVDPYKIEAIRAAMFRLLNEKDFREELASRGPAQASRFGLKRQAMAHAALYKDLLSLAG